MEENKHGGKRVGAGRKKSDNPKETVSLFVEKKKIWLFGNKENLKERLYKHIDTDIQDLTKPTNEIKPFEQPKSNFTVNTMAKSFEQYRAEKRACELPEQWETLKREIDADQYLTSKQKHLLKTIL